MSKEYKITSSIAIIAQTRSGTYASAKDVPDQDDVQLAQEITDSAIYVLQSESTLKAAIEYAGLTGVTVKDIASNLNMKQYNETQIIEMSLDWRSSSEGVKILDAINAVSGEILLETLKIGNVSVVNFPSAKYVIGGKVSASTWIMCAALGAGLAAFLCILKLFLSPQLTNVNDFQMYFSTEVLSTVSYDKNFGESVPYAKEGTKAQKDLVTLSHIVANRMDADGYKRLIVTSTIRGEGRTVLTANIANQFAENSKKTLMVDCDFRNPTLSSMFDGQIVYEKTMNALYCGKASEDDVIKHISGCLDLLPVILSDDEIALDEAMLDIINRIAERYDYVLFDCAPIGMDAEVLCLKRITDAALYVTKYDYAELDSIDQAVIRIKSAGINVIGGAVTSVKTIKDIISERQKLSAFIRKTHKRVEKESQKAQKSPKEKKVRRFGKKKKDKS